MQITPSITFRGMEPSAALEADIVARLHKLDTYYRGIMGCRVLVERPHRHHETGNRFHVRIDLTVPGDEIVVVHDANLRATAQDIENAKMSRTAELDPGHKDAFIAVHAAFDAARRRLQDYARRQRGDVKKRIAKSPGRVAQIFPVDEFGYIEGEDGHEVFFHKRSVLEDAFDRMTVGTPVSFVEEPGDKGPQASTVTLRHPRRNRRPAQVLE